MFLERRRVKGMALWVAVVASLALQCACYADETEMGLNLTDPNMLYDGHRDTLYASMAYSRLDDTLISSGLSYGILGNYSDAEFGSVSSVIYTQVALPQTRTSMNLRDMTIDSVMLYLVKESLYPDSSAAYNFHMEVRQLAEAVKTDSVYRGSSEVPVASGPALYDGMVTVGTADTLVSLQLSEAFYESIIYAETPESMIENAKGLRISILPDGDEGMMGVVFSATKTKITVYYHLDTLSAEADLMISNGANHFMHYEHQYAGSEVGTADSVDGAQRLYFDPLAGHDLHISFDQAVSVFAERHPQAVIHSAVLVMPVAGVAQPQMPDNIIALHKVGDETFFVDDYLSSGYNGGYDEERGCYSIRLSRHLQQLLRNGGDHGLRLILNSRASSASRVVLEGLQSANPPRIEFVYTE